MDQGNFLTDSGSKIPKAKPPERIPQKPVLSATSTKTTNHLPSDVTKSVVKPGVPMKTQLTSKRKIPPGRTLAPSGRTLKPTQLGAKRHASTEDIIESTAPKVSRTGFPYKAKAWELKLRLAECEEWYSEARSRVLELEAEISSNAEELSLLNETKQCLEEERIKSTDLQFNLSEKTKAYDKLHADSKQFLDTIASLERDNERKEIEKGDLQAMLKKERDEGLVASGEISKLRMNVSDLEFQLSRQKVKTDDFENSLNRTKNECSELRTKLSEREHTISELQERVDKVERENKFKENTIKDLEDELVRCKCKISDLERNLGSKRDENNSLTSDLSSTKDDLFKTKNDLAEMTALRIQALGEVSEMKNRFCDSEKHRRFLHNQVQDLKGNIRVFCRVRPPLPSEKENCLMCSISYPDDGTIEVSKADPFENNISQMASRPKFQKHEFTFDRVFHPSATQAMVFEELSQLVQSALDGYNVCIFAYGQTGSGKTYTMEGPNSPDTRGMIPRTVEHIFESVSQLEKIGWDYKVEVCFIEIYNEVIRDLLRNDKDGSNLKIMQVDGRTNDVVIPGLTVMEVKSYEDLDRLYILAHQNRIVASTCYNERSSRSHSVTKIKVTGIHKERGETCYGSLNLVDLAGSERLSDQTSANDPRFREMKNINKSLSELGNVILGLYQKNEHIPYRNSKLTHLLQPALGGSSKTLMLVNISPVESCMSESLCSLRFAQKVNQVKIGATRKRITYDTTSNK